MKWFETKEIKNKENLSPKQIEYIRKSSLTIFGPLNILIRKHWDLVVANLSINFVSKIVSETNYFLLRLLILAVYFWLIYFGIIHGRRLAWNENGVRNRFL